MRNALYIFTFLFLPLLSTDVLGQTPWHVDQKVLKKLKEIKPDDTDKISYKVEAGSNNLADHQDLRLDLVFKIGHYEWDIVALRFERKKGHVDVDVTKISFGSSLAFYREHAKPDRHIIAKTTIPVSEFDELLEIAARLYNSKIEKKEAIDCIELEKGHVTCSSSGYSISSSSGDGSIILRIQDPTRNNTILSESGKLHSGNLAKRSVSGIEYVRVHLFWEVFYEHLEKNAQFRGLPETDAETMIINRVKEDPFANDYRDYFRRRLYVSVLERIGTAKSVPSLKKLSKDGLDEDWKKNLQRDIDAAIKNIESRSSKVNRQ